MTMVPSADSAAAAGRRSRRAGGLRRGREIDAAPAALTWTSDDGQVTAVLRVLSGTAVVSLAGPVGRPALSVSRNALEAAIRVRPTQLIVDLDHAYPDQDAGGLLALMARASIRHGMVLHIASVPPLVLARLAVLAPAGSYQTHQSLPVALRTITGTPRPVVS